MMHPQKITDHPDVYFSNYHLEKDTQYFLYIGSLRYYELNIFLAEALSRIHNCKFDFIATVQDVLQHYYYRNLIVVNPLVHDMSTQHGRAVSCRIKTKPFMSCVSQNDYVHRLVRKLLGRQKQVYLYMYQSFPEMTLDHHPDVLVIGPDSAIADRLNSKVYQYRACKNLVPLPDFRVCNGLDELLDITEKLWSCWTEGIFVSKEYSVGGLLSIVAHSPDDIARKFQEQKQTYIISRYLPHTHDPTVLAVVANENDVYIAGIADQFIEHGTRFVGSIYPTILGEKTASRLKEYTRVIGKWLAGEGFRGIFGCDYAVDAGGRVLFIEVNARKQGTILEFCSTLENSLPSGSAMLPELEYYAVTQGKFPDNTVETVKDTWTICWGTHYCKNQEPVTTCDTIYQNRHEREAFKNMAENKLDEDVLILEHIGSDMFVTEKSFLARIVSLGRDHSSVREGLSRGKKAVERTISPNFS